MNCAEDILNLILNDCQCETTFYHIRQDILEKHFSAELGAFRKARLTVDAYSREGKCMGGTGCNLKHEVPQI